MTGSSSDRRRAPRIPVELHVEFHHLGRPSESYRDISRNISSGGVFLDTTVTLDIGTRVHLEISPAPGARSIRVEAEVVRVEEDPAFTGSKATTRTRGMALRFLNADQKEISRLVALTEQMQADNGDAASD